MLSVADFYNVHINAFYTCKVKNRKNNNSDDNNS